MSVCHFEKKMGVIRRMEDGQTRFNVCKSVELLQWAVSSNITSVEKVKQRMGHAATGSATAVSYSRSKYFQKKKLRNYFHCGWMTEIKKKTHPFDSSRLYSAIQNDQCRWRESDGHKNVRSLWASKI